MPDFLLYIQRPLVCILGVGIIYITIESTIHTLIVPRAINNRLTRSYYILLNRAFRFWMDIQKANTYRERDRIMAVYVPMILITLPFAWLSLVMIGYGCLFWGLGFGSPWESLVVSGSSLLTLGTVVFPERGYIITLLMFSEAMMGMILVALLIAYLPTIYSAFSEREKAVSRLETPAGVPPSPFTMLIRLHRIGALNEQLGNIWVEWRTWFHSIDESHTSLSVLVFLRSPKPEIAWITAAGVVLDTAALTLSLIDIEDDPRAALCIRAGYVGLRDIADFFALEYNPDPGPDYPISISREEFDDVCQQLEEAGLPLVTDKDQAWADFRGWRVNYDTVLLQLAALTMAPYAMWISDRSLPHIPNVREINAFMSAKHMKMANDRAREDYDKHDNL